MGSLVNEQLSKFIDKGGHRAAFIAISYRYLITA